MKAIVIGAGVFGASAAYHLVAGGAEVVLVDAAHDGRATAAGAGIINPWSAAVEDPHWYRLSSGGARYYPELARLLAEDGQSDIGYRRVGSLSVNADPAVLDPLERRVRERRGNAPEAGDISRLSAREARGLFPPLRDDLAAVHISGAARVNGRLIAAALAAAAQLRGVVHRRGTASLIAKGERVRGVRIGDERIEGDAVVVTAGAWAPELLRPLGADIAIEPQRGQIVHLQLPGVDTSAWPVVLPMSDHYLLAFDDGRVVVGATRETGAGFDYRVTAEGQAKVLRDALSVAPGLGTATLLETRIGFRPMAPILRPMIGTMPGWAGLFIGNGLGSSGLTIGPYAGKLLAELVLHDAAGIDLAPYDPQHVGAQQTAAESQRRD